MMVFRIALLWLTPYSTAAWPWLVVNRSFRINGSYLYFATSTLIVNSKFLQKKSWKLRLNLLTSLPLKTFNSAIALSHWFCATIPKTMRCFRSFFHLSGNFSLGKSHTKVEPNVLFSNNFASIEIMNRCATSLKALVSVIVTKSFCFSLLTMSLAEKPIFILLTLKRFSSLARSISFNCYPFSHFLMILCSTIMSNNLITKSFRSQYRNEIIGWSVWYFFRNGSTMFDTKLKNWSLAI